MDNISKAKKAAGEKAASMVKNGMCIGLGTGSTTNLATAAIGKMVAEGLEIKAIPTSEATAKLAHDLHIPLVGFSEVNTLDLDIDGADEVSAGLDLIKGGGASLLREKIVALASLRRVIVIDEHKLVTTLGKFPLPLEVVPFGWELICRKLAQTDCRPARRMKDGTPVITDNGNYIIDCRFEEIPDPAALHEKLKSMTGIIETGLFTGLRPQVIIGYENGEVAIKG